MTNVAGERTNNLFELPPRVAEIVIRECNKAFDQDAPGKYSRGRAQGPCVKRGMACYRCQGIAFAEIDHAS